MDKLIEEYAATTDTARQHEIVKQLEAVMVNDVPVIPVTEGVDWYQYNTKDHAGWVHAERTRTPAGGLRDARTGASCSST